VVEDEANYEQLIPSYGGGAEWMTRQSAWQSQIGGAFGYTYGGQGVWWGCYNLTDGNFNCGSGNDARAWYQTIDFPVGGTQLTYMKNFWTSLPWWMLEPNSDAVIWTGAPTDTQRPFQKALTSEGSSGVGISILVAYLPQNSGKTYAGTVSPLFADKVYNCRWFDPRLGTFISISTNVTGVTKWTLPTQPDGTLDWVFLLQSSSDDMSFVSSIKSFGKLRSDSTTSIGMQFTVSAPTMITALGRYYIINQNTQSHILRVIRAGDGVLIAQATIDMNSGQADALGFKYAQLESTVTLASETTYYLVSNEESGGDQWYDDSGTIVSSMVGAIASGVYWDSASSHWVPTMGPGACYGPLTFSYLS